MTQDGYQDLKDHKCKTQPDGTRKCRGELEDGGSCEIEVVEEDGEPALGETTGDPECMDQLGTFVERYV